MWKWMDTSIRTRLTMLVAVFAVMIAVVGFAGISTGRATNDDLRAVYLEDAKGLDLLAKDTINLLWARIHLTNFDSVSSPEDLKKLLADAHTMVNTANDAADSRRRSRPVASRRRRAHQVREDGVGACHCRAGA